MDLDFMMKNSIKNDTIYDTYFRVEFANFGIRNFGTSGYPEYA